MTKHLRRLTETTPLPEFLVNSVRNSNKQTTLSFWWRQESDVSEGARWLLIIMLSVEIVVTEMQLDG